MAKNKDFKHTSTRSPEEIRSDIEKRRAAEIAAEEKKRAKERAAEASFLERKNALLDKELETTEDLVKLAEIREQKARNTLEILELRGEQDEKEIAAAKEKLALKAKSSAALKNIEGQTASLVEQVTGISDKWSSGIFGSIKDSEGGLKKFGQELSKNLSLSNILGSSIAKIAQSTAGTVMIFDQAQAELAGLVGQGGKYNNQILQIADQNRKFGAGISRSAKAVGELHVSMLGFSELGAKTQNVLAGMSLKLENFGIAAAETGETMNELTKAFKMTVPEAAESIEGIVAAATALNIPPSQMLKDYKASLPKLAHWGKESINIFKKVAAAAKGMGMEAQTLLDMTAQYDTFEGAASAVGKLNAIMGGDMLNAYTMLNATEEERIALVLEAKDALGKSWKEMDRYERKAYKNAAGIQSMEEAAKLFGQTASEYRAHQEGLKLTAEEQKKVEERAQAALSVQQKWAQVMESFAIIVGPIVDKLHSFTNQILNGNTSSLKMIRTYAILMAALWGFGKILGFVSTRKKLATAASTAQTTALAAESLANSAATMAALSSAEAAGVDAVAKRTATAATNEYTVAQKRAGAASAWAGKRMLIVFGKVVLVLAAAAAVTWGLMKAWDLLAGTNYAGIVEDGMKSMKNMITGGITPEADISIPKTKMPSFPNVQSSSAAAIAAKTSQAAPTSTASSGGGNLTVKLYIKENEIADALFPNFGKRWDQRLKEATVVDRAQLEGRTT